MERYRIKIIKKYKFDLSGENKEDISSEWKSYFRFTLCNKKYKSEN